jgi:hypothetical protein
MLIYFYLIIFNNKKKNFLAHILLIETTNKHYILILSLDYIILNINNLLEYMIHYKLIINIHITTRNDKVIFNEELSNTIQTHICCFIVQINKTEEYVRHKETIHFVDDQLSECSRNYSNNQ